MSERYQCYGCHQPVHAAMGVGGTIWVHEDGYRECDVPPPIASPNFDKPIEN